KNNKFLQKKDLTYDQNTERKKGAAYVAESSVYRYRRFIVKEKKRHRKWNHLKFVFSIFCGIMSIERDSWHPGEETALS
ncbi:hypothetical protein, partial [Dialister succinatiphilus]|uniref:hypothetical protein n=1 Tax=Dialister succinatiphilus TaxID=487173 RepID=UPI003F7EF403